MDSSSASSPSSVNVPRQIAWKVSVGSDTGKPVSQSARLRTLARPGSVPSQASTVTFDQRVVRTLAQKPYSNFNLRRQRASPLVKGSGSYGMAPDQPTTLLSIPLAEKADGSFTAPGLGSFLAGHCVSECAKIGLSLVNAAAEGVVGSVGLPTCSVHVGLGGALVGRDAVNAMDGLMTDPLGAVSQDLFGFRKLAEEPIGGLDLGGRSSEAALEKSAFVLSPREKESLRRNASHERFWRGIKVLTDVVPAAIHLTRLNNPEHWNASEKQVADFFVDYFKMAAEEASRGNAHAYQVVNALYNLANDQILMQSIINTLGASLNGGLRPLDKPGYVSLQAALDVLAIV